MYTSRRHFIRTALGLSTMTAAGGTGPIEPIECHDAADRAVSKRSSASFLYGGNDSNNLVVPLDTQAFDAYKQIRAGLALDSSTLVPFDINQQFGLHSRFTDLKPFHGASGAGRQCRDFGAAHHARSVYTERGSAPRIICSPTPISRARCRLQRRAASLILGWAGRLADQIGASQTTGSYPLLVIGLPETRSSA